jgi:hypothetical protein
MQHIDTATMTPHTTATENLAKRKSVSVTAGEGPKFMRLTILARRTRNGGEVVVMTTDAKKKTSRGMTTKFDTFEAAAASVAKLVHQAVQKGWKRSERAGGFKARPDAFTSMPVAPKGGAR